MAACVPGAELTEVLDDDQYKGRIAVRLGPVALQFAGTVEFRERDAGRHHAVISATGNELKGRGNAYARVVCDLRADGTNTRVDVETALDLAGQVAQYGRGAAMIESVAQQLMNDFASALALNMQATGAAAVPAKPAEFVGCSWRAPGGKCSLTGCARFCAPGPNRALRRRPPVKKSRQPLWPDRRFVISTPNGAERILDRRDDRRRRGNGAAFARALDAERIQRRRRFEMLDDATAARRSRSAADSRRNSSSAAGLSS